jgi:2-oxoglutarate/2-oxoacid ferredoxin oxidoreductase subunit beta
MPKPTDAGDASVEHANTGNGAGRLASLTLVPRADQKLSMKEFKSDQEVRWCPGCGDYAILAAFQSFLPELEVPRENVVIISGIGCSSRLPYYVNSYGLHSIHGRAPAIATGLAASRQDLSVWVITGDGDALSIGGNHLIHALRRNVPIKILLFNNQIYGLTKGQASPTSELGKVTKSTPFGSIDGPFNPVSLAIGAEATFVARTVDTDKQHLPAMLRAAAEHEGAALVEIYQNCPVFNDGAFDALRDKKANGINAIRLEHGRPIRFGVERENGVARDPATGELRIVAVADVGEDALVVHDAHRDDPSLAFALSRLSATPNGPTPIGIFRSVERPVSGRELSRQLAANRANVGAAELDALLRAGDTWTVA